MGSVNIYEHVRGAVRDSGGPRTSLLFGYVIVVILPAVFVVDNLTNILTLPALLALGLVVFSGTRLTVLYGSSSPRILDAMFWIFVYVFMGLAALTQTATGQFPLSTGHSYQEYHSIAALVLIWIGAIGYLVGTQANVAVVVRGALLSPRGRVRQLSAKRLFLIALIGLLACGYTIVRFGTGPLFESREAARVVFHQRDDTGVRYWINDSSADQSSFKGVLYDRLTRVPTFVALYLLLYRRKSRPVRASRPGWETPTIALLVVANFAINNPFSSSRASFGGIALAIASIYLPLHRPSHFRLLLVVALAGLLLVFPYADYYRRSGERTLQPFALTETLASDGSYSAFQMAVNGVVWVEDNGHTMGRHLLGALFNFVPRAFWPGKPTDTGNEIGDVVEMNLAAPLWTEFYVDFGAIGVLLGFFFFGSVTAFVDRRYRSPRNDFERAFVPAIAPQMWYVLRGSLLPSLAAMEWLTLFLVIAFPRRRALEAAPDRRFDLSARRVRDARGQGRSFPPYTEES